MARPRWSMKNTSPISAGATVSAAPAPMPWKMRAASKESYDLASPHHAVQRVMTSVAASRTGRRPIQFESGTHKMLEAPRNRTLT